MEDSAVINMTTTNIDLITQNNEHVIKIPTNPLPLESSQCQPNLYQSELEIQSTQNSLQPHDESSIPSTSSSQPNAQPSLQPTQISSQPNDEPPPQSTPNPPQLNDEQLTVSIANAPQANDDPPPQKTAKLPLGTLLIGRKNYKEICVPLYNATMKGNWKAAKTIIDENPDVVRSSITEHCETILHVAASTNHTKFVKLLVMVMEPDDILLQNIDHNTALCLATSAGTVEMAKSMVEKKKSVLTTPGNQGMMPLYMAVLFGNHALARYLFDNSEHLAQCNWTPQNRHWLLVKCLEMDMFGLALDILRVKSMVPSQNDLINVLQVLARKPAAFVGKKNQAIEALEMIWNLVLRKTTEEIRAIIRGHKDENNNTYPSRALFLAAEYGNSKFIIHLISTYPDLIWKTDEQRRSIFHVAVVHRQESVYNLLFEIGSLKDLITPQKDANQNNMLHLAAKIAKRDRLQVVSGVALQMQRELQWFKQVETMIPPLYRYKKNDNNQTPQELFSEEHKSLVEASEIWMKGTASQCMVAAALIATVVFAAAYTVPGGYEDQKGFPVFLHKTSFLVFVISDAISLFLSATSILIFLSILTSRYAEQDFLVSLPRKLMLGLATLFLSITTMVIAFSASFFDIYNNGLKWTPILIAIFAGLPVVSYVLLQLHLFIDVIRSTFRSRYLFKTNQHMLY